MGALLHGHYLVLSNKREERNLKSTAQVRPSPPELLGATVRHKRIDGDRRSDRLTGIKR